MPSRIAITQAIISSAPDAPMQWACIDLVDDTESSSACSPKTRRIASRLELVVVLGAGAVRVEVVDVLGREAGVGEAQLDRRRRPSRTGGFSWGRSWKSFLSLRIRHRRRALSAPLAAVRTSPWVMSPRGSWNRPSSRSALSASFRS